MKNRGYGVVPVGPSDAELPPPLEQVLSARSIQRMVRKRWQLAYKKTQQVRCKRRVHFGARQQKMTQVKAGELAKYKSQIVRFMMHPLCTVSDPSQHLGIIGELFFFIAGVCWIMTAFITPEVMKDNPLMEAWGYNNICVGFDMVPMRYIAACAWTIIVAFSLQYTQAVCGQILFEMEENKNYHLSKSFSWLMIFVHLFFFFSTCTFLICFMIPPTESREWHTRPFLLYMVFKYLSTYLCCYEHYRGVDPRVEDGMPLKLKAYLAVYGAIVFMLPVMAELTYRHHDAQLDEGKHVKDLRPLLPPWFSATIDWSWILCQIVGGQFMPQPDLIIDGMVFHNSTIKTVRKAFGCKPKELFDVDDIEEALEHLFVGEESVKQPTEAEMQHLKCCFADQGKAAITRDPTAKSDVTRGLSLGCFRCRLVIFPKIRELGLPAVGLFAQPGAYYGIVRINVTEHGAARMSIRLEVPVDVVGDVLKECDTDSPRPGYRQIDLLLAEEFKQFFCPSVSVLATIMRVMQKNGSICSLCGALLKNICGIMRSKAGVDEAKRELDSGRGICGKAYYAGLPFKLGRGAFKFGLTPLCFDRLRKELVVPGKSFTGREPAIAEALGKSLEERLGKLDPEDTLGDWSFVVQRATDDPSHKIEPGDAHWDERCSPYSTVGELKIMAEQVEQEPIAFSAWNMLKAHQPLGQLNKARLHVYRAHASARKQSLGEGYAPVVPEVVCPFAGVMPQGGMTPVRPLQPLKIG